MKKPGRGGLLWLTKISDGEIGPEEHRGGLTLRVPILSGRRRFRPCWKGYLLYPWEAVVGRSARPASIAVRRATFHGSRFKNLRPAPTRSGRPSHIIQQSADSARRATHCRPTAHRSKTPCVPPSPEFLQPGICASFPSRWFPFRPT